MLEIVVSPEDDAEIRRLTLTQPRAARARDGDHVLRRGGARAAGGGSRIRRSPNLFVQTEYVAAVAQPASRSAAPRKADAIPLWAAHVLAAAGAAWPASSTRPIARASSVAATACASPIAVMDGRPLSNTAGAGARPDLQPAHPACELPPEAARSWRSPRIDRADRASRSSASATSTMIHPPSSASRRWRGRTRRCSCTTSASTADEANLFQQLADALLYSDAALRARRRRARARRRQRARAVAHGISGDLPIVLLRDRRRRRARDRAPAAARTRVLAHQAARRRSGRPEREGR